ncbi:hypothetical protein GCM10027172_21950 [Halomonas garicola]
MGQDLATLTIHFSVDLERSQMLIQGVTQYRKRRPAATYMGCAMPMHSIKRFRIDKIGINQAGKKHPG